MKKEDLGDLKTAHKGLTVFKYKESNLGPVTGFTALIIIIAKRLVRDTDCFVLLCSRGNFFV